jgi:hypothetical protein
MMDEGNYQLRGLLNFWSSHLQPDEYRCLCWSTSDKYYFAQHKLSLAGANLWGDPAHTSEMWLLHAYMAVILPSYVQESQQFYLTHTDLSIASIMVCPTSGKLMGIIDWEFANTLPLQAAEQYPGFLAEKDAFVEEYKEVFEDAGSEFNDWQDHYAKQFQDDPEISALHDRIDVILSFEFLLRNIDERTIDNVSAIFKALKTANALVGPLPRFPWDDDSPEPFSDISPASTDSNVTMPDQLSDNHETELKTEDHIPVLNNFSRNLIVANSQPPIIQTSDPVGTSSQLPSNEEGFTSGTNVAITDSNAGIHLGHSDNDVRPFTINRYVIQAQPWAHVNSDAQTVTWEPQQNIGTSGAADLWPTQDMADPQSPGIRDPTAHTAIRSEQAGCFIRVFRGWGAIYRRGRQATLNLWRRRNTTLER